MQPRHIHFEVWTKTSEEMESCDLRFYEVEKVPPPAPAPTRLLEGTAPPATEPAPAPATPEEDKKQEEVVTRAPTGPNVNYKKKEFSDVAFFRLGYFDYAKLNTQNMIEKYKAEKWYVVDLLMDWNEQRVSIYIDN